VGAAVKISSVLRRILTHMSDENAVLVAAYRSALSSIDAAAVPTELREVAFVEGLRFLLPGGSPTRTGGGVSDGAGSSTGGGTPGGSVTPADRGGLAAIAKRLHVDGRQVERVYDVDDDGVHLTMQRAALDAKKSQAMVEVTYLIVAARQALRLEEWTGISAIRAACDSRGVLDSSNFARAVHDLEGIRFRGDGAKRAAKMNQAGFEKAAAIVARIAPAS
jgi:hypothetical protein